MKEEVMGHNEKCKHLRRGGLVFCVYHAGGEAIVEVSLGEFDDPESEFILEMAGQYVPALIAGFTALGLARKKGQL